MGGGTGRTLGFPAARLLRQALPLPLLLCNPFSVCHGLLTRSTVPRRRFSSPIFDLGVTALGNPMRFRQEMPRHTVDVSCPRIVGCQTTPAENRGTLGRAWHATWEEHVILDSYFPPPIPITTCVPGSVFPSVRLSTWRLEKPCLFMVEVGLKSEIRRGRSLAHLRVERVRWK